MPAFADWFARATDEHPKLAKIVREIHPKQAEALVDGVGDASYPWNVSWDSNDGAAWLRNFLMKGGTPAADFLTHEAAIYPSPDAAIYPSPDDRVVLDLARNFRSSAAWVFALHGNVRDYAFDATLGYAPWANVLESYWRRSALFHDALAETAMIRYSLSAGVELWPPQEDSPGQSFTELQKRIEKHRQDVAKSAHDERVFRDLSFLRDLLAESHTPATLLLFERPALLFPAAAEQIRTGNWVEYVLRWAAAPPEQRRHMIVLSADTMDELHPELRKRVNGILQNEIHRPASVLDRRRFLLAALAACNAQPVAMPLTKLAQRYDALPIDVATVGKFANATAGLSYTGIEACLLNILQKRVTREDDALQYIKRERGVLLRAESEGLIELVEPTKGLRDLVGGLDAVRERLELVIRTLTDTDPVAARLAPMGALFVGPPGTGKSLTASALAFECGKDDVHFVKLGDFRDMWVGQSERNFSRILRLLESFGKVIVFIDELDQSEGGARTAEHRHETSKRIFGKLLEFMANPTNRGRILWIAATNRPKLIDAALLRPGRFDLILPFDPPDEQGCREILDRHLAKIGLKSELSEPTLQKAAAQMAEVGFTGAEIEFVVTETARRVFGRRRDSITDADLESTIADYDASVKKSTDYEEMLKECRAFVPFRSLRSEPQA